jgi:DNA repair exonuclease SbcCD ATPase subunit
MKEPAELADPKKLPDDLKLLLKEHHVSNDDPLVAVLAWHWARMNESRDVLRECTAQLTAALDERQNAIQERAFQIGALLDVRLKQLDEWTNTLQAAFGHLENINKVLSEKPLGISEQITKELAHPIGQSVTLVKQLATDTAGLISDVEKSRKRLSRSHLITAFLSGYATAALILSWTFSHFFSH